MPPEQKGLSLIETLISLTIALLIVGSLVTVFVAGHRNYRQDLQMAKMQESARYALKILSDEIAMLGFLGNYPTPSGGTGITLNSDCGPGGADWALQIDDPFQILVNTTGAAVEASYGCIDDEVFVDGTDVLAVKRVEGLPIDRTTAAAGDANQVFMRSSPSAGGSLVLYDGTTTIASHFKDWRYLARIYYIRDESQIGADDGVPTLYRMALQGQDMVEPDGGIARGIEYFHIEFGVDWEAIDGSSETNPNGAPNFYTATPTPIQLAASVTAKVYVLARSRDEITGYVNDKTYNLGSVTRGPFNDGYYRRVFSTTLHLRNVFSRVYVAHIKGSI